MTSASRRRYLQRTVASLVSTLALAALPATVSAQSELGSPERIRQVKADLGVKSTQNGPWSDYVAALQTYRQAVRDVREAEIELMGGTQAIEGSDDAVLKERQTARLLAKAVLKTRYEAFYGALDPDQQQIADATLTAGECGR
jgi:hypothetical protein